MGIVVDKHPKSVIARQTSLLSSILIKMMDIRRLKHTQDKLSEADLDHLAEMEAKTNENALKMIYKLNDASFRPIFLQIVEWATTGLSKTDRAGRALRRLSLYGFLLAFFDNLKSIVTTYATYIVEDAVDIMKTASFELPEERQLWSRVLETLAKCFEHDQDDFWQAPSHFGSIAPVMMEQFLRAAAVDADLTNNSLIPATVELAAAADSQAHQKELNSALLKCLKSERAAVRLAAVKCEQALTDRLGEEWLAMLHEMLPRISELQEDDDEEVERETHEWIVKIEGVLGEGLDAMLQ